jgi:hypothetical protein
MSIIICNIWAAKRRGLGSRPSKKAENEQDLVALEKSVEHVPPIFPLFTAKSSRRTCLGVDMANWLSDTYLSWDLLHFIPPQPDV